MQKTYSYSYSEHSRTSYTSRGVAILSVINIAFLVGFKIEDSQDYFHEYYPYNVLATFVALLFFQKHWNPRSIVFLFVIFLSAFFIEALGMKIPLFGTRYMGNTFGERKFFGIPPALGIYWLTLIYCVGLLIKNVKTDIFTKCAIGAGIMVLYDILLEPVAGKEGFWFWGFTLDRHLKLPPIQNYCIWFVASFFMLLYYLNAKAKIRNDFAPYVFIIMAAFLLLMNIA